MDTFAFVGRGRRFADWARGLDNRVLGRPVPDERPLGERLLRPRPAVWSWRGRVLAGMVIAGMFAALRWGDPLTGVIVTWLLLAVLFIVGAADERKRARRYYGQDRSDRDDQ